MKKKMKKNSLLIKALTPETFDRKIRIMVELSFLGFPTCVLENLWEGESYAGELMLCKGLVPQARHEHISQTCIELVYYYLDPHTMVTHRRHKAPSGTLYGTENMVLKTTETRESLDSTSLFARMLPIGE